jgi:hypothetical protein
VAEPGSVAVHVPALPADARQRRWPVPAGEALYVAAALLVEALIAADAVARGRGWLLVVLLHLAVVSALVAWIMAVRRAGRDTTTAVLAALLIGIAGPIGAALALLYVPISATHRRDSELLAAWYERLALSNDVGAAERLADDVAAGRTLDPDAPAPVPLGGLFARGSIEERQAALGLIARHFHFDYGPALSAALRSEEPVLRAQAAAVAARVRTEVGAETARRLAGLAGRERDGTSALEAARWLERAAASGFLDPPLAERARLASRDLAGIALAGGLAELEGDAAQIAEAELLRRGRYADFRLVRRLARIRATAGARLRRIAGRMPRRHLRRRPA